MASPDPLIPYRKVQVDSEREMRGILESTAKAIERRVRLLRPGIGGQVRAAQLRLILAAIRKLQRDMWTGSIDPRIRRSMDASEKAAETAIETMTRVAYAGLPEGVAETLVAGLRASAVSGLKSERARKRRDLSARVYKQRALHEGKVEQIIREGLIANLSARELSREAYKYVSPTTPGGASYAAMRLARTEINNAFHERQIQGAKRPGVKAVKWNLSGSHRVPDLCNVYAEHGGKGEWAPDKIPEKPHPQCFCYLTYVMMDSDDFRKKLQSGGFDDEIDRRTRENMAKLGQKVGNIPDKKAPAKKAAPTKKPEVVVPIKKAAKSLQTQISDAIEALQDKPEQLISLARLRDKLSLVDRQELDRELKAMNRARVIQLEPDPNRQALTQRAKDAALVLGGEDQHLVVLLKPIKDKSVPRKKKVTPTRTLEQRVKAGIASEKVLSGGNVAKTDLVTLKDGSKVVRKVVDSEYRDPKEQQDAEELAAALARELGITAPNVYRPEVNQVYMDFMPGDVAISKWKTFDENMAGVANLANKNPTFKKHAIKTALLDLLIVNTDRNPGNWLLNGDDVVAIDHGMSFAGIEDEDVIDPLSLMIDAVLSGNPFTQLITDADADDGHLMPPSEEYSQQDLNDMMAALNRLRPTFKRLGQEWWYHASVERIEFLRPYAKGKGRLFT